MENKKQPNSVSVNSALHTRGLSDNSQNLGILVPVYSNDCPSSWDELCDILSCASDYETSSVASSLFDFDYEQVKRF